MYYTSGVFAGINCDVNIRRFFIEHTDIEKYIAGEKEYLSAYEKIMSLRINKLDKLVQYYNIIRGFGESLLIC